MLAGFVEKHENFAFLPCTFKVQHRAPVLKWVRDFQLDAIPGGTLVKCSIWVHCISSIEAMGYWHWLPLDSVIVIFPPHVPYTSECAPAVFPALQKRD